MRYQLIKYILLLLLGLHSQRIPAASKIKSFIEDLTNIEEPLSLRDPFKQPMSKIKSKNLKETKTIRNTLSNLADPKGIKVGEIEKVTGTLIGNDRRAFVSVKGKMFTLKEGFIDADGIELKAILPGGLIFVEKLVNVYGQEEFIETVVPISR